MEINSTIYPPICKILNYGKFIYKKNKQKKNIRQHIKEIKFRLNTNNNDYNIKIKNIIKFIKKKYKIKISIFLRGREIIHKDIVINMLNKIQNEIKKYINLYLIFKKIEGRIINMILTPKKK